MSGDGPRPARGIPDGWRRAFRLPLGSRAVPREVDEELAFHLAMKEEKLRRAGLSPEEAHRRAREAFGAVHVVRDTLVREARARARRDDVWHALDAFARDMVVGMRGLRRVPGFTVAAILTLALGIGASTAIATVAYGVLLRPLPFAQSERLVQLSTGDAAPGGAQGGLSAPEFLDVRAGRATFADAAAWTTDMRTLTGSGRPERVATAAATASLFTTLGVRAGVGRLYGVDEDRPGRDDVVVLGHGLWERVFAGDSGVVGRSVRLDGTTRVVLGVLPRGVHVGEAEAFVPLALDPGQSRPRGAHYLEVVARLAPGLPIDGARRALAAYAHRSTTEFADAYPSGALRLGAVPLREAWVGETRATLLVLTAAVALLLVLACTNVAYLQLARAESRQREVAVRAALGAGRRRVAAQLLTESALLAVSGAALGIPLAVGAVRLLLALAPDALPDGVVLGVDAVVATSVVALVALAALLAGLAPAAQAATVDVRGVIASGLQAGGARGARLRRSLVVAEVAMATVVLVCAALVGRSFWQLQRTDPGFADGGVLAMDLALAPSRYPDPARIPATFGQVLDRLRAVPGVQTAAVVSHLPLSGRRGDWVVEPEGRPVSAGAPLASPDFAIVSTDYFRTIGIPVLAGRDFGRGDAAHSVPVVVVSRMLARALWPGQDAVGRRLRWTGEIPGRGAFPWLTVVGIVGDVRAAALGAPPKPTYYVLDTQLPTFLPVAQPEMTVLVRATGDVRRLVAPAREAVWAVDPEVAPSNVRPLREVVRASTARQRLAAHVLLVFAAAALLLAVTGVYGVLAHTVVRRRREFAIRIALGEPAERIRRRILTDGVRLAGIGVAVGTVAALASARVLGTVLEGVGAADPAIVLTSAAVLLGAALAASAMPAWRSTRVAPQVWLRPD